MIRHIDRSYPGLAKNGRGDPSTIAEKVLPLRSAKLKQGDAAQGDADVAAGKAIQADIAEALAPYGLK
jgi:hypothetical protein